MFLLETSLSNRYSSNNCKKKKFWLFIYTTDYRAIYISFKILPSRNFTKVWYSSINARFVSQTSLFMSRLVGHLLFDITLEIYYRGMVNAVRYRIVYSSLFGFKFYIANIRVLKNSKSQEERFRTRAYFDTPVVLKLYWAI